MKEKKTLFSFAGKHKWLTVLGCILSGISAILTLIPFLCIWKVVDELFHVLPDFSKVQHIETYGWYAVLFSLGSIVTYYTALMCTHLAAFRIATNIRSKLLKHSMTLPLGFFNENGSGKLRRVMDEVAGQTESFLAHELPDLIGALVMPIAFIIILFVFDWRLGLVSLVPNVIGFMILGVMMKKSMNEGMKHYQNALEEMNNQAVEYIRGVPVVKTFQQSIFSFKLFHNSIKRYTEWVVKYTISLRIPMTCHSVAINAAFAFLIPAALLLVGTVADYRTFLTSFVFYMIITPITTVMMNRIMHLGEKVMLVQDAMERVNNLLGEEPLVERQSVEGIKGIDLSLKDRSISFKDVSFTYEGSEKKAVDGISFTVPQGQTYALVGPSGGGKSTIASLIPRFFDVESGSITIGGVDIRDMKLEKLMELTSFVFQQTSLFKETLRENICAARPDATYQEMMKAIGAAQCEEIIEKMPKGLDTVVGTKGVYLSGGENQRIALARAILKDAPIILLDEATAFADPENEHKIQQAFKELTKGKTVMMVAHRLSTIQNADCILVIEDGKIRERGTHQELLDKNGLYRKMWDDYQSSVAWKLERRHAV